MWNLASRYIAPTAAVAAGKAYWVATSIRLSIVWEKGSLPGEGIEEVIYVEGCWVKDVVSFLAVPRKIGSASAPGEAGVVRQSNRIVRLANHDALM